MHAYAYAYIRCVDSAVLARSSAVVLASQSCRIHNMEVLIIHMHVTQKRKKD